MTPQESPTLNAPEGRSDDFSSRADVGEAYKVQHIAAQPRALSRLRQAVGKRTRAVDTAFGPAVRAVKPAPHQTLSRLSDIALGPTLRAAAQQRSATGKLLPMPNDALRRKVRLGKVPNLILFVVDASGSMAARRRMTAVKGAIFSLLIDAYQKRDQVGLITFRGLKAETILPPTSSISLANQRLKEIPTGGRTPLAAGLHQATIQLEQTLKQSRHPLNPLIVLLSDGRANVGQDAVAQSHQAGRLIRKQGWSVLVIDCEQGYPRLGLAHQLAQQMGSQALTLDSLSAETLANSVRSVTDTEV